MLQTVTAEKVDENNVVIWLVSMFSSWVTENLKVTKNLYYVMSTRQSQIPIFLASSSRTKSLKSHLYISLTLFSQKNNKPNKKQR